MHIVHEPVGDDVFYRDPHAAARCVFLNLQRQGRNQHEAARVLVVSLAHNEICAFFFQRQLEIFLTVAVIFAVAQLERQVVVRTDTGQIDPRDAGQVPLQETKL